MGTKVSDSGGGGDFTPCPAGLHRAICVAYVDLGTQEGTKFNCPGETTWRQQVVLMWETPDETIEIDGESKPYVASKFYTKSLSPKANLTADLESWRGRVFTDEERKGFDLDNILGVPCLINVIHETKNNKTRAKVVNVLPLSKGMAKPEPSVKPWRYDVYEDFRNFPKGLTEGFKKMILKCREMSATSPNPAAEPVDDFPDLEPEDKSSIPF